MRRRRRRLVVVGVALILCAGCRTVSEQGGLNPLLPVPPDATDFSDYEPDNPYLPSGKGVAERSVYTALSPEGYSVEIRDILVAPTQPEEEGVEINFTGAAVLEVQQGSGKATAGERKIELHPGTAFSLNQGELLWLTAHGEPLSLRTWIVSPRRKP